MALTADRLTSMMAADALPALLSIPVKASTLIYAGALVCIEAGYAVPGSLATGLIAVGRAESKVDNSAGASGDLSVQVRPGVFRYANSAGADAIAQDDLGKDCYVVDDQTVALTSASATRSLAGRIVGVDSVGVHVLLGMTAPAQATASGIQSGTTTLIAGTKTVTGVVLTASSRIVVTRKTPGAGAIGTDGFAVPSASRDTALGQFVINAIDADKTTNVADISTVDYLIVG